MDEIWIKQEPYVDERCMWMPVNEYVKKGSASTYRCVMTREMFIEAYNKWIKNANTSKYDCLFRHEDSIDDWWGED
jgi:hypothetical protein